MKKIKLSTWKIKTPEGEKGDSTLNIIAYLLKTGAQKEDLSGFESMRKIGRISRAIEDAEGKKFMEIEDGDFDLLKKYAEKYTPAIWGNVPQMLQAVEDILNADKGETDGKEKTEKT